MVVYLFQMLLSSISTIFLTFLFSSGVFYCSSFLFNQHLSTFVEFSVTLFKLVIVSQILLETCCSLFLLNKNVFKVTENMDHLVKKFLKHFDDFITDLAMKKANLGRSNYLTIFSSLDLRYIDS